MITLLDVLRASFSDHALDPRTPIVFEHNSLWRKLKLEVKHTNKGDYIVLQFETEDAK